MEQILSMWPTMADLAKDIGKPYSTVAAWKARGKIPADHDYALIEAAEKRGKILTLEKLAQARRGAASFASDAA